MGLKYIYFGNTTGSLSYCPYWSDCGTIASYCRAIAGPARQPSFPYSLIRVIPSLLTAAPLPSPSPAVRQQGAGPLPGASTQPRETRKKGARPQGFPLKAPPQTQLSKTRTRVRGSTSRFLSSLPPWGTYSGLSPTPPPVCYNIPPTTLTPWSDLPGFRPSSPLPSPASSGSRRFPP